MLKNVAEGHIIVKCPSRFGLPTRVSSILVTVAGSFYVQCNGCDFSYENPTCRSCMADAERHWKQLHQEHPDRCASQLIDPPFEAPV